MREEVVETLRGKRLILHFDGKIVKEMSDLKNICHDVERIAISVTSPDFHVKDDILLGIIQSESSKGSDQAEIILKLLEYYEISEQIVAVCTDTTSSNTGVKSGAIVLLSNVLGVPLLWLMCRHHIFEVHISHFMTAVTGEKTKSPRRALYTQLQEA